MLFSSETSNLKVTSPSVERNAILRIDLAYEYLKLVLTSLSESYLISYHTTEILLNPECNIYIMEQYSCSTGTA